MDISDKIARAKFPTVIESLIQIAFKMGKARRQFIKHQKQYEDLKKRRNYWLGVEA